MSRPARLVLIAVGAVVALLVIAVVSVPLFLNADNFRARIESTVTKSLGRKVTMGKLTLSIWSGGLVADKVVVADDPRFSTQPFIQADTVKIKVEMMPLVLHRELQIHGFALQSPKIQLLRAGDGTWNYSTIGSGGKSAQDEETKQTFPNLTVGKVTVENGQITLGNGPGMVRAASAPVGTTAVYQKLDAEITNLSPTSSAPFTLTAQLPGGGSLSAKGNAGPLNQQNSASTPVDAQVDLKHFNLGTAGVLPTDAGIGGVADLQAQVKSDGQMLNATGTAQVAGIKLATNGRPSSKPVQVQFNLTQNERAMTGQIQQATITVGRAVIHVAGTFQTSGPTTALNLKVTGNGVPIDDLEAFLPAVGVSLPQGSQLRGGTLTTALTVSGSTGRPVVSGPVRLDNTQLAGFNLGSKLESLSQLTGGKIGSSTGNGTTIRSLSMDVQESGGAVRTDRVALDVAGVGTATGAGSVSAGGALNYNMVLKLTGLIAGPGSSGAAVPAAGGAAGLAGALSGFIPGGGGAGGALGSVGGVAGAALRNGIPVAIGGTTSNPTFAPNLGGLMKGAGANAAQGLLNGKGKQSNSQDPLSNALGGLIGKH
jgi:AsmA protein